MSSTGTMCEMTPLLPWRPAILSPGCTRRFTARYTFTIFSTPGARSSPAVILARFSSSRFSKCLRCAFMRSAEFSSCAFASSSSRRISNHVSRGSSSRYAASIFVPLLSLFGPPAATLPSSVPRTRSNRSSSRMRCWSCRSLRTRSISALLDRQRPRVLLDAVAREHAHVDHGAVHARRHAQRRVLHVGGLLAEDRPQQLLFRRQLGLALRRDLADQDVAGAHFGADERDARLVELGQRRVTDVRDVGGDFLRTRAWCRARRRSALRCGWS